MILIVEDEPIQRMLAADLLQEAGYDVCEAGSGDEALALLRRRNDVTHVFTDVRMPGKVDGLTLARTIADRYPDVRVVITSAHVPSEEATPHCVRFVPKPWTSIDVLNVVV